MFIYKYTIIHHKIYNIITHNYSEICFHLQDCTNQSAYKITVFYKAHIENRKNLKNLKKIKN